MAGENNNNGFSSLGRAGLKKTTASSVTSNYNRKSKKSYRKSNNTYNILKALFGLLILSGLAYFIYYIIGFAE